MWADPRFKKCLLRAAALPSAGSIRDKLTAEQYRVTQESGTERAFTGEFWDKFEKGIYVDVVTGEPLFSSTDKYESGCGWPAFTKPIEGPAVVEKEDLSHGIQLRQKICKTEKRPYQHLCWHGRKSFKACFTPLFLSLYQKRGGDFVVFDRLKKAPALLAPEPSLSLTSLVQRKF